MLIEGTNVSARGDVERQAISFFEDGEKKTLAEAIEQAELPSGGIATVYSTLTSEELTLFDRHSTHSVPVIVAALKGELSTLASEATKEGPSYEIGGRLVTLAVTDYEQPGSALFIERVASVQVAQSIDKIA